MPAVRSTGAALCLLATLWALFSAGCGALPADRPTPSANVLPYCTDGDCSGDGTGNPAHSDYHVVATQEESGEWRFRVQSPSTDTASDLRFVWNFGDGTGDAAEGPQQAHAFPNVGTYLITVTAFTADGHVAFVLALEIEISPTLNVAPVARGGADRTVTEGEEVCLDGSASADPNNDEIEYTWRQLAGPTILLIKDESDPAVVCFNAPRVSKRTVLVFVLTVSDGEYAVEDTVTISVGDSSAATTLAANAGLDVTTRAGDVVTLDGTGSQGADDSPMEYEWTQLTGSPVTLIGGAGKAVAAFHAPEVLIDKEVLTFQLTVRQGESTSSDVVRITVLASAPPQSADYFEDFESYAVGDDPAGWFDTSANNSLGENGSLFSVMKVGEDVAFGTSSTRTNIHSHYLGAGDANWSSLTYSGRMMITDSGGGIGVTFLSHYPDEDVYYRLRRGNFAGGKSFHIEPHGTNITGGKSDSGVVPEANKWYAFEIETSSDSDRVRIRAKVWPEGSPEPDGWQIDCYDSASDRPTSGTIGVWGMGLGIKYWDDLGVKGTAISSLCSTDSDADGVMDCEDVCPGQPDIDMDGDGNIDCLDACPTDPQKSAPGVCGCGVADEDLDGDGQVDCVSSARLCVSRSYLSFGATTTSLSFDAWNCGVDTIGYTVRSDAPWLAVTPASGVSGGETKTITATASRNGLAGGTYQGNIIIEPEVGPPITIAATVSVQTASGPGLTPIARWDVVPYQRVAQGETFNCGVVAFSQNGIDRVEFSVNGRPAASVTSMTYNHRTGVYEYWYGINANGFSSGGPITVTAKVYGNDGGTRTLDPLPLVVDPDGDLPAPQAWVDASRGNDSTGAVNNASKPYRTIGKAVDGIRAWMSANGFGNRVDGGIVRLMPGTHRMSNGGVRTLIATSQEWLTITTAAGGTRANTRIVDRDTTLPKTKLICCKGITVQSGGQWRYVFLHDSGISNPYLWLENCAIIGSGRWMAGSHPVPSSWQNKWFTNSYIYDVDFGFGGGVLARGLTIEHIGNDAFQHCPMVVNCVVDDVDPGSTGWHSDAWQWFSTSGPKNTIAYGYRCDNAHCQGVMCRTGVAGSPRAEGVAFVNTFINLVPPYRKTNGPASLWMRSVDHFLMWNCTFEGHPFNIYDDQDGQKFATTITHFDVRGCMFNALKHYTPIGHVDTSSFDYNHYETSSGPQVVTPGLDSTTGAAGLDSYGRPVPSSQLRDRISPPLVPVDADGTLRDARCDVGAYEH